MAAVLRASAIRWPAIGAGVYCTLASLWVLSRWIASHGELNAPGWLMLLPLQVTAILVINHMLERRVLSRSRRLGWQLMMAAFFVDVLAFIDWNVLFAANPAPLGTSADVLYLLNYALLAAACGAFFVSSGGSLRNPRVLLDGATLVLGVIAGLTPLFVSPLLSPGGGPAGGAPAALAYGVGIVATSTMTVLLCIQAMDNRQDRVLLAMAAAIGLGLLTDVGSIAANLRGHFRLANVDDLSYCWSYVAFVSAPLLERDSPPPAMPSAADTGGTGYRFVPVFAVTMSLALLLGTEASSSGISGWTATIVVLAGICLLLVRQLGVRYELARLKSILVAREAEAQIAIEKAISTAARQAAELRLATIGNLTAGMAHEFNNQLMVTLQAAGLLAGKTTVCADAAAADLVAEIQRSTRRSAAMTAQLLGFAQQQHLRPCAVNLHAFLGEFLHQLPDVTGAAIRVVTDAGESLPPAWVDPQRLTAALLNLAANSRDAMPRGGVLTIRASADEAGDSLRIDVADQGCGMSPEVLARATDPFFTTRRIGDGAGLGLSMVDGFARQSGGEMVLRSEPGQGTTVTLRLPVASA